MDCFLNAAPRQAENRACRRSERSYSFSRHENAFGQGNNGLAWNWEVAFFKKTAVSSINMFRAIASDNFAPFEQLRIELPAVENKPENLAEVHLITGVNGSGKTRILSVLSAMLGSGQHLQKRMKGSAPATFLATSENNSNAHLVAQTNHVGWQSGRGDLMGWCQKVPAFAYSGYAYVTDSKVSAMGTIRKPERQDCLSFNKPETSSQVLLQAITNLLFEAAVDSLNISADDKNHSRAARLVKSLESTLLEITGTKFQFKIEKFPEISLFVVWGGTKLPFDVLPDGLRAIIGWLVHALVMMDVWLQGKGDPTNTEAVFLLGVLTQRRKASTMRAKTIKPMKRTSNLSKREKTRR